MTRRLAIAKSYKHGLVTASVGCVVVVLQYYTPLHMVVKCQIAGMCVVFALSLNTLNHSLEYYTTSKGRSINTTKNAEKSMSGQSGGQ